MYPHLDLRLIKALALRLIKALSFGVYPHPVVWLMHTLARLLPDTQPRGDGLVGTSILPDSRVLILRGPLDGKALNQLYDRITTSIVNFCQSSYVAIEHVPAFLNASRTSSQLISKHNPTHIFLLDYYCFGFPGPLGPIQNHRITRTLAQKGIGLVVLVPDLLEFQPLIHMRTMNSYGACIMLLASRPTDVKFPGPGRIVGPCPELAWPLSEFDKIHDVWPNERRLDAWVATGGYEPRASWARDVRRKLLSAGVRLNDETKIASFSDYMEALTNYKIYVNSNYIRQVSVGKWPKYRTPTTHMVGGNFDAIAAGCLLISQRCDAVADVLIPGQHFIEFDSPAEAATAVVNALEDWQAVRAVPSNAFQHVRKLLTTDSSLLHLRELPSDLT